mgnify:CR=1 FL=1
MFAELDAIVKPTAILATNTSTLPVIELAMCTSRPELVCGIHFFNPAPMMKLVEVINGNDTSAATTEAVADREFTAGEFAPGGGWEVLIAEKPVAQAEAA